MLTWPEALRLPERERGKKETAKEVTGERVKRESECVMVSITKNIHSPTYSSVSEFSGQSHITAFTVMLSKINLS